MKKIWGHRLPNVGDKITNATYKHSGKSGFGGAIVTNTKKEVALGRSLGRYSLISMFIVVPVFWVLFVMGMLAGWPLFLVCLAIIVSHILFFACDTLTGGDAGEAGWAVLFFWIGVPFFSLLINVIPIYFGP